MADSSSTSNNVDGDEPSSTTTDAASANSKQHIETNQAFDARRTIGDGMHAVSNIINEHIIAARYVTFATVALLGAVGIARTPLFHRYKSISEIPKEFFAKRKTLHGRIIHIFQEESGSNTRTASEPSNASGNAEAPVICLVRHLSPVGRLLSKTAFNFSLSNSPAVRLGGAVEKSRDLLKIEIAGIKAPPSYRSAGGSEQPGEWLNRLAANRTSVACTLIARRIDKSPEENTNNNASSKRGYKAKGDNFDAGDQHLQNRAICQVKYRPRMFSVFRQDLASTLIAFGRANVLSSGMCAEDLSTAIIDGDKDIKTLQADAKYLENLASSEFEAVKELRGMWSDQLVRQHHPELVEEAEFEQTASTGKKLWRWLRERVGV